MNVEVYAIGSRDGDASGARDGCGDDCGGMLQGARMVVQVLQGPGVTMWSVT